MLSLFLPERCLHCDSPAGRSASHSEDLPRLERYLCPVCRRMILGSEGPTERDVHHHLLTVASALPVKHSIAAFLFKPESPIQSVIHSFKYAGMPRLAEEFGRSIAGRMPEKIDCVISVPLHRTRLAERGYNQAEALAIGLSEASKTPVIPAIKRIRPTPTQTKLSIPERIENVRGAFALTNYSVALKDKHILIVDDVMTTGSTLASVAETALRAKPRAISLLTLAIADG